MNNAKKAALFGMMFVFLTIVGAFTKLYFLMFLGIASLIAFFIYGKATSDDLDSTANKKFSKVLKENNFTPDKKTFSFDQLSGLAINEETKQIAYVTRKTVHDDFTLKLFRFKDIIEAKVISNKDTVTSTSIGSTLVRGIGGAALAGGIGAIIFGTTAKQKSSQKIKDLTLEFVVDDLLNPRYILTFYKSDLSLDQSSNIIQNVETWYRIFSVIIKRNSQEARSV